MEPIPESREADQLYGPFLYQDADLLERLVALGDDVRCICPGCFGLSLSLTDDDITFTVVAAGSEPGGSAGYPRPDERGRADIDGAGPLGEESWALFAAALSTAGVASTLSLPVRHHGSVTGSFNLYGSTPSTFEGHHAELADVLGAWEGGAVTNADLDFATRDRARQAPGLLRDSTRFTAAAGLLAHDRGVTVANAGITLRNAADQAGVPLALLVDSLLEVNRSRVADPGVWHSPPGG